MSGLAQSRLNLNTTFGKGFAEILSDDVAGTVSLRRADVTGAMHDALTMNQATGALTSQDGHTVNGVLAANGTLTGAQSATAAVIATSGTIATAGVVVARVAPAAAVTGVILEAGTYAGQMCWVVNESAAADSVTFAASGTSNVADGTSDVIDGLTARLFVWDSGAALWFRAG